MPSNALAAAFEQRDRNGDDEARLPARTAALGIFVLALVSWAVVLIPIVAFLHR